MTALAVSPTGVPLGIAALSLWTRGPKRAPAFNQDERPVEEKETWYWLDVLEDVADRFGVAAPGTVPWVQMDRGADRAHVVERATGLGLRFTLRSAFDRKLPYAQTLWSVLARARRLGTYQLDVPAGPSRSARRARIDVRCKRVRLRYAMGPKNRKPHAFVELWAVEARERHPPRGEARILWRLLTNYRVFDRGSALAVINGYTLRWRVEQLHYAWKSGLCNIERSQLRAPDHFAKWATLLATVAARAERLKMLSREEPELPATAEFTRDEIDAVILLRKPRGVEMGAQPTLGQVVRWIADIGGYTGKSSGGPPGAMVIGRALPEVAAAAVAVAAMRPRRSRKK